MDSLNLNQPSIPLRTSGEAFAALMEQYGPMVYATCRRLLGNRDDLTGCSAEDATQEIFFKLARNTGKIQGNLGAWLHTCATNHCISLLRSGQRKKIRDREYEDRKEQLRGESTEMAWKEVAPHLDAALEELPEPLRLVLVEHYLQCKTQTELAQREGVSIPTISRRIDKALASLRQALAHRGINSSPLLIVGIMQSDALLKLPAILLASSGKIALGGSALSSGTTAVAGSGTLLKALAICGLLLTFLAVGTFCWWAVSHHPALAPTPHVENTTPAPQPKVAPDQHQTLPTPNASHWSRVRLIWEPANQGTTTPWGEYRELDYDHEWGIVEYRKQGANQIFRIDTGRTSLRFEGAKQVDGQIRIQPTAFKPDQLPEEMRQLLLLPAGNFGQRIPADDLVLQGESCAAYRLAPPQGQTTSDEIWIDNSGRIHRMVGLRQKLPVQLTVEYNQSLGPIYEQAQNMMSQIVP